MPVDGDFSPGYYDTEFVLQANFTFDKKGLRVANFDGKPFVSPETPLLPTVLKGGKVPDSAFPLYVNYGDVVQIVVNNPYLGHHPFHLHGHSFWVLGTGEIGDGDYDPNRHELLLDGVKRDTFSVQQESWGVIRFIADNPGVWAFHCHIDWHNLSGMSATIIAGADVLRQNTTIPAETRRVCLHHGIEFPEDEV